MARQFPSIVNFGSAFRFALEAEQAGADFAAAAEVAAPDEEWRTRFEELVCTHDDRVEKLEVVHQKIGETTPGRLGGIDAERYTSVLAGEPATTWPEVGEQIVRVEETIAAFHEDFVAHADDALSAQARHFKKAAEQNRQAAEKIRGLLG